MMDEQSAGYLCGGIGRFGRSSQSSLYREKLDIKGLQLFENNPKPVRIRIRGRGPRVPYEHGVRPPIVKKALGKRREPEKAGGKI
jgi:hypothetical protein